MNSFMQLLVFLSQLLNHTVFVRHNGLLVQIARQIGMDLPKEPGKPLQLDAVTG